MEDNKQLAMEMGIDLEELVTKCQLLEEQVKELRDEVNGKVKAKGQMWIGFAKDGSVQHQWEINVSDIFSKLIKLAGRYCDSYASDIFYSLKEIDNKLNDGSMGSCTYVFAFRDSCVDYKELWELHKDDYGYYREVWFLDVIASVIDNRIWMELHK